MRNVIFFFFSSRRRHTRFKCDWSSDVCSSDLDSAREARAPVKDIDDTKAPLLDHLIELRRRLLWVVGTLLLAFFVCLAFARPIFAILVQPLLAAGQGKLIYTDVFEAFFAEVKVAFFAALMLTFPVFAIQL